MKLVWEKLGETEKRVGYRWIIHKQFRMPDGTEVEFTTVGRHAQNVAVIAITTENEVVVAKQFRPGPERVLYELPGGMVDKDESVLAAAKRELLEETGYATEDELLFLGHGCRDAYKNETDTYYLATACRKVSEPNTDATEFIAPVKISIEELISYAKSGEMSDAPAVLMAYEKLQEIQHGTK